MHTYSIDEGKRLVAAARNAIELSLKMPNFEKGLVKNAVNDLMYNDGVFVTIEHYPGRTLRGCIGFPRAVAPIKEGVVDAAVAAAFEDPRFVPVSHKELDQIVIEVSTLSEPKPIGGRAELRSRKVKVGRDGLIVKYGFHEGLLLPIVAVEQGWNSKRFLEETCIKAGIDQSMWMQQGVNVYTFQTQVFREESPGGRVVEVTLK
ncbi:TIGR00296 family protein [Candidatus Marsarchaeota archaeon]|nr:TIGR00296 family protein [Candidatus Marsarchaeota archaeon]